MTRLGMQVSFVVMSLMMTACGQGFNSNDSSSAKSSDGGGGPASEYLLSVGVDKDVEAAQVEAKSAETTMQEAVDVFNKIVNEDGSLNLDIGPFSAQSEGVGTQFNLFDPLGIAAELRPILNTVLDKIRLVPDQMKLAREKLLKAKEDLDVNHPEYNSIVAEIDQMLQQLDQMEVQLDEMLDFLVDKIDWALAKFDSYIAKIPVAWGRVAAEIALADLKGLILEFRNTLATL